MLLYTKVAPPKVPKRRSRAEKKKKCDEVRPACSRCAERGLDCCYEAVRPRQRRKRDSVASFTSSRITTPFDRKPSFASTRRWSVGSAGSSRHNWYLQHHGDAEADVPLVSPLGGSFDPMSLSRFLDLNRSPVASATHAAAIDLDDDDDDDDDNNNNNDDDDNGNEGHTSDASSTTTSQAVTHISRPPDLAMIAPCPVGSPLLDFRMPAFSEFSDRKNRRALVAHFCNQLSHLIVFREETGNPFQELVLPLTADQSPVMNAIYALSSAHLEYRGVKNQEQSLHFHNEAIQGLATMINHGMKTPTKRNELLAAIMLLVYYEVLVQRGRSNLVDGHLKGAMTIMNSYPAANDATGLFLERAFRFYDVIAALSFGTAPLSQAPGRSCLPPLPPTGLSGGRSPLSSVDTLLGMSTSLWPIIHRLSKLSSDKRDLETACKSKQPSSMIAVLKTEFETNSRAIERELETWQPTLPPGFSPDDPPSPETEEKRHDTETAERSRLHSIFNNAMAYRHSCFVYLYHTIYGYPRTHPLVQSHGHTSLWHCLQTCSHAGPMGALLWPLFVASCEAVTERDRKLATDSFKLVEKRQGMLNIKWAWDIVQEVWRLADLMEEKDGGGATQVEDVMSVSGYASAPDLWRQVSKQMGISIVFG
ncbi:hypothetical protein M406DRAFT_339458 [Cryphonectria parasitica EP155]|uniref:Zn(2)-C6 fungal-type domain-containing protein n=1 Tax=Cryphonectria parasitica (strain ATCC 38755 / EP155) TaxID=660469 RepID=A0A9P5CQL4_CRYP1|nr:uncharacterized protein M406DRAFT_339458 [Cryphonectria parasitica EP155]KAF3766190.1 hypothetical protein M406DRAFT_339458 [Cryphonectria parasitica EP155]